MLPYVPGNPQLDSEPVSESCRKLPLEQLWEEKERTVRVEFMGRLAAVITRAANEGGAKTSGEEAAMPRLTCQPRSSVK